MNSYQEFCRKAAGDGMVLLRNENAALPLTGEDTVALFGRGQFVTFKSGCGSGDVVGVNTVSALEGFQNAGISLCRALLTYNRQWHTDHFEEVRNAHLYYDRMPCALPEIPLTKETVDAAAGESTAAVVILGRLTGEGKDIRLEKGDYYLSDAENEMLSLVRNAFRKVIVCLNWGNPYDLQGVLHHAPDAVLYMSQGGQQVGNALADVLLGKNPPAGKLTDTWAADYADYPSCECFGQLEVPYREGIFVGYRYFDTFGKTPLYPFGFGLSYTEFSITPGEVTLEKTVLHACVTVKNTGSYAGREVVQCYLSVPDGRLRQPYQQLAAFAKTKLLAPGEETEIILSFDFRDNASYCTDSAAWVLPAGSYYVRIGSSSRSTHIAAKITLAQERPVLKTVNRFPANMEFTEITPSAGLAYTYEGESAEKLTAKSFTLKPEDIDCRTVEPAERHMPERLTVKPENRNRIITIDAVAAGEATPEELVAQFSLDELGCILNGVNYGKDVYEGGIIGSMADAVPGAAGETFTLPKYGIRGNVCADGPAGIRLLSSHDDFTKISQSDERRTLTAYPTGTCFAASWDTELMRQFGACISREMERFSIHGWLAPGMNIHRNPLCGRNFEYFSEDPFLSGVIAAAETDGVQLCGGEPTGRYVTVKHFIANEQEALRTEMTSQVTERALREIYLKPFEIAVKRAQPHALMTSYNRLNGCYTTVHYGLLAGVLRSEWGFDGIVMSDWGAQGALSQRVLAGNDLNMPGSGVKCIELLKSGEMDIAAAQACAVRIIRFLVKTSQRSANG